MQKLPNLWECGSKFFEAGRDAWRLRELTLRQAIAMPAVSYRRPLGLVGDEISEQA
ncbi:MAG: hypothetical protein OEQ39_19085 [Gammaproteobacteria bacterium]|nr:hypothetical protein [Gammaproteobacteria bacterium]MDH3467808.1 hypothetical protein [Gammaproteobacteria bacterium]